MSARISQAHTAKTPVYAPEQKTHMDFRASDKTVFALALIQTELNIDKTSAIELAIARMAAWLITHAAHTPNDAAHTRQNEANQA